MIFIPLAATLSWVGVAVVVNGSQESKALCGPFAAFLPGPRLQRHIAKYPQMISQVLCKNLEGHQMVINSFSAPG